MSYRIKNILGNRQMNTRRIFIVGACSFLLISQASAACLQRVPADGTPGVARIFVPASQVSQYEALGYQLVGFTPSDEILDTYLHAMCDDDPYKAELADRFGVEPAQLCASVQALIAEKQ